MRRPLAMTVALLLGVGGATPTTAPTTAPTTTPTTAPAPPVGRWFDQLADPDPAVRDAAHESLMGLPAERLPDLLAVVRAAAPVRPDQAAALREIVCQVVLAAETYDADEKYILAQEWPRAMRRAGASGSACRS